MDDTKETHPSFGQLEIGRITSSARVPLYGTSNQCREYIRLTIHHSELHRNLHHYWHFSTKPIIEIAMSPAQFAEAITSLNTGSGTPVTIERIQNERIEPPPYKHDRDLFEEEFSADVVKIQGHTNELIEKVKTMAAGKTISKKELNAVIKELESIQQDINCNIPFIASSFNEHLDKSVSSAKIEIDAFIESKIRDTGMKALRGDMPVMGELPPAEESKQ